MRIVYIQANNDGLRCRTLRGAYSAKWTDVTDFYFREFTQNGKISQRSVVKTDARTFTFDSDWFGDVAGFRAMVQERAIDSRAKSWERFGLRRDLDWPREFQYTAADNLFLRCVLPLMMAAYPAMWLWILWPKIPHSLNEPGIGWTIAMLCLAFIPANVTTLLGAVIYRTHRKALPFLRDTIIVSADGLTLRRDGNETLLAWSAVCNYYIDEKGGISNVGSGRYIVESAGKRIEFNPTIADLKLLCEIIQREATSARAKEWKNIQRDVENLDTAASKWTGGAIGHGTRLFHYRTRSTRAHLVCLILIFGAPSIQTAFSHFGLIDRPGPPAAYIYAVFAVIIWNIWRYQSGGIAINSYGITERTPFGDRTIAWPSISRYGMIGDDSMNFGKVSSESGRTVRFWTGVSDVAELLEEISRRAPQAKGDWKTAGGKVRERQ